MDIPALQQSPVEHWIHVHYKQDCNMFRDPEWVNMFMTFVVGAGRKAAVSSSGE